MKTKMMFRFDTSNIRGLNSKCIVYDPIYGDKKMLRANFGYVIVEVIENPSVSPGGITLPENAVKPSNKGIVVDTSQFNLEDFEENLSIYNTGDVVFFPLYAGHKIDYNGKEYTVLKEEDILAFEVKE